MSRNKKAPVSGQGLLFSAEEMPERTCQEPKLRRPKYPVWTKNKAAFIARYLKYFVYVTKHGTYIDGFAGPQNEEAMDAWAARLVLENEPFWLRNFYLFETDRSKIPYLQSVREENLQAIAKCRARGRSRPSKRSISIFENDSNVGIQKLLRSRRISDKAVFALLDQHTFECHWETVRQLANYKSPTKIEQFYFLATGWINRSIANQRDEAVLEKWWGGRGWRILVDDPKPNSFRQAEIMCARFKQNLGYASVKPWAIYESPESQRIMYFMIHATDHPEAPQLMRRAYAQSVGAPGEVEQFWLDEEFQLQQPDTTFQEIYAAEELDLTKLSEDLAILRNALKNVTEPEQVVANLEIWRAEKSALSGNGPATLACLRSAGEWVLDVATEVGVPLAARAIRASWGNKTSNDMSST